MIRRILGDVDTRPDEMMVEMIERVGIGGDFLKEKETARRLRAGEHFTPGISSRQADHQWVADGRDEVARARERRTRLCRPAPSAAVRSTTARARSSPAICGVTAEMMRARSETEAAGRQLRSSPVRSHGGASVDSVDTRAGSP